jgi:hypothetical protein
MDCTEVELMTMTVKSLRVICKQHSLPVQGRKELIVKRILTYQFKDSESKSRSRSSHSTEDSLLKFTKVSESGQHVPAQHRKCLRCQGPLIYDIRVLVGATDFLCYSCQLADLSPVDSVIEELLQATKLNRLRAKTEFIYSASSHEAIEQGRGTVQVQARCMKVGQKTQSWPKNCVVVLNDSVVFENKDYMGQDYPLNLTNLLAFGVNTISLHCERQEHILGIFLVKCLDVDSLIGAALNKVNNSSPILRGLTVVPRIVVPLICPLLQGRVRWPGRGEDCSHVDCFDLKAFYEKVRNFPEYGLQCPICDLPVLSPQMDLTMLRICNGCPDECKEIAIDSTMCVVVKPEDLGPSIHTERPRLQQTGWRSPEVIED